MSEQSPRDEIVVEITNEDEDRKNHAFGVNDHVARAVCGTREEPTDVFDRARSSRPIDGHEDRVECVNCRRILNLTRRV